MKESYTTCMDMEAQLYNMLLKDDHCLAIMSTCVLFQMEVGQENTGFQEKF